MRGRLRGVSSHEEVPITGGWMMASTPAGAAAHPSALGDASLEWIAATVPSTAASALRDAGRWSVDDEPPRSFDAEDWWFRTTLDVAPADDGEELWLRFGGLATLAKVWLDGELILESEDMFVAHEVRITDGRSGPRELAILFRSIDAALAERRPRPAWRSQMLVQQQLRWIRTTLLGRTPGWSPNAAAVGPWQPVVLERRRVIDVRDVRLRADGKGRVDFSCALEAIVASAAEVRDAAASTRGELVISREGQEWRAPLARDPERAMPPRKRVGRPDAGAASWRAVLEVPDPALWWPHTHGAPALYDARLELSAGEQDVRVDLGRIGFRSVHVNTSNGDFTVSVNEVPVFCRGACWTPLDVVSLVNEGSELQRTLDHVVAGGMNMLRVSGPMLPADVALLDACDEHGVLLWHDLPFANLDYPGDDPRFAMLAERETRQLVRRVAGHACIAVICGNGEAEQQAAMWGAYREKWSPSLFHEVLAAVVREEAPEVTYWPSSAHGGAFPHAARSGTTSYYGVGAYRRPLEDARRAELRFATECLAFANVGDHEPALARAARDLNAQWDFGDVRDHYVGLLYGDAVAGMRETAPERWLDYAREATGEVMAACFTEWRRASSPTRGALVWWLRDLWPSAGFGLLDAKGRPKAAYWHVRRALAPIAIGMTDEGTNGVAIHVVNDPAEPLSGVVSLALYRWDGTRVGAGERPVHVAAHAAIEIDATSLFDHWVDLNWAHRFGGPPCDVIVATLRDGSGSALSQAMYYPVSRIVPDGHDPRLEATAERDGECIIVRLQSRGVARSVRVRSEGFAPSDDHFDLAPGDDRVVTLMPGSKSGSGGTAADARAARTVTITCAGSSMSMTLDVR